MQLYPAIDIKNGKCVRLRQGQFNDMVIYSDVPEDMAKHWEQLGASWLHIVDLDGALAGHTVNEQAITQIIKEVNIPVQIGGGIRSLEDIEHKLQLGVHRVIIGTKAVQDPQLIKDAIHHFGKEKIVIGIDAKDGLVAVEGWEKVSELTALELCKKMEQLGVTTVIYTDIAKDGMLMGPNLEYTSKLIEETSLEIIASGGISSLKDLENLKTINASGAIIGKALYTKNILLDDAIKLFER